MKVYIVLHHEVFPDGETGHRVDEMVFYIVSSLAKAIEFIKDSHVDPYSWWEIQAQTLDDPTHDWPEHVGYYGRKGGKLKAQPYEKCVETFEQCRAKKTYRFRESLKRNEMSEPRRSSPKTCPRCGKAFQCGMNCGDKPCWCAALPNVIPVPGSGTGEGCLCPECLRAEIQSRSKDKSQT